MCSSALLYILTILVERVECLVVNIFVFFEEGNWIRYTRLYGYCGLGAFGELRRMMMKFSGVNAWI